MLFCYIPAPVHTLESKFKKCTSFLRQFVFNTADFRNIFLCVCK